MPKLCYVRIFAALVCKKRAHKQRTRPDASSTGETRFIPTSTLITRATTNDVDEDDADDERPSTPVGSSMRAM